MYICFPCQASPAQLQFHAANGKAQHALMNDSNFFPCFQAVPRCPKMFPIAPGFYPIWFAQSSTPLYIIYKGKTQGCTFDSILQLGVQRGASIGGMPNVSQKSGRIFFHFPPFLMCSHQVLNETKYFQQMNFKAFACLFYPLLGF